ncbi:MAG: hypothetical protein IPP74_04320 [Alphaproteobacteria bacterium]|nr:hypothetical protein [Alphaproteobacteria bacterium]
MSDDFDFTYPHFPKDQAYPIYPIQPTGSYHKQHYPEDDRWPLPTEKREHSKAEDHPKLTENQEITEVELLSIPLLAMEGPAVYKQVQNLCDRANPKHICDE